VGIGGADAGMSRWEHQLTGFGLLHHAWLTGERNYSKAEGIFMGAPLKAVPFRTVHRSNKETVPFPAGKNAPLRSIPVPTTKIKPRPPNRAWVERGNLIAKLEMGAGRKLTLVSAPAGSGKTCLASQWIERSERRFAWLTLDEHDNDLDIFVRNVIAALQTRIPGFASEVLEFLSGFRMPEPRFLADRLVLCLDSLEDPIWLVLDDCHAIFSSEVHSFLRSLMAELPATLRLVVVSRDEPPWLQKRWFVENWINEIRAGDLGFSLSDTSEFFRRAGVDVDRESLEALHETTEGWIAGLQLAQIAGLTGGTDLHSRLLTATGEGRFFSSYLVEEVLAGQSEEIRRFLAVSSLLDRFCVPLCDALLDENSEPGSSSRIIQQIQHSNLFLVPLDSEGVWFRYHHLFADVLRSTTSLHHPPEERARIQRDAARWFAAHDLGEEALRFFLAAGEIDDAVLLLEDNMHATIQRDMSRRKLNRELRLFPSSVKERFPALLVAEALYSIARIDLKGIVQLLNRAEALLKAPAPVQGTRRKNLEFDIEALRSACSFWQGNGKAAVMHAGRALRAAVEDRPYSRGLAAMYGALGHCCSGGEDAALALIGKEMAADCTAGCRSIGALLVARAMTYFWNGNLALAEQAADELEEIGRSVAVIPHYMAMGAYFRGRAAFERNDLDLAAKYFSQAKSAHYQTIPRVYQESLLGLAMVAVGRHDFESARKFSALARKWALEVTDPNLLLVADSFDARLAMLSGCEPRVVTGTLTTNEWIQPWCELPYLTRLECLVHTVPPGKGTKVLSPIGKVLHCTQSYHNVPQVIQVLTVKAIALWHAGRQRMALEVLQQAMQMGKARGFVRSLVDRTPLIRELLQAHLGKNPEDEYAHTLIAVHAGSDARIPMVAAPAGTASAPGSGNPVENHGLEPLSNREIDVLMMLAERLSNKEIAQRLFVTPETAKKHTANIYRKLGVHGRREAVNAAARLGILAPRQ
jgi:LuxR family maltose regulon positive regulatory protein